MRLPHLSAPAGVIGQGYLGLAPVDPGRTHQALVHLADQGPPKNPAPGCWFNGTSCKFAVQSCHYCCGDGRTYSNGCGWCFGWWDAPPCR